MTTHTDAPVPGPAVDEATRLAAMSFAMPFRHYQQLALRAFETARVGDDRRIYLTMPPGSGKTVLALEIGRRIGRPVVVLAPTAAIQAQWIEEWSSFVPEWPAAPAMTDDAPVRVLTYQSLCVLEREDAGEDGDDDDDDDAADPGSRRPDSRERARRRRLVIRGGDPDEVLGLLHANGRAIVERLAAMGPITLVLDESHHLLQLWGHVLKAVIDGIDPGSVVVGLTATPPDVLSERDRVLHGALFGGHADFQVITPAVVKDGYLAPYQELALVVEPLDAELRFIELEQERFERLRSDLLDPDFASVPFGAWFATRIVARRSLEGVPVGWEVLERADPLLAQAALRHCWEQHMEPPRGARFREQHRQATGTGDWMALIDGYVRDVLDTSREPVDVAARDRIRRALPGIGYRLTRAGIRATSSVVDRVLASSASKPIAVGRILAAENRALGERLRAAVLCDFERAGPDPGARLRDVLAPGAGSAAWMLRALLDDPALRSMAPVLMTGRRVACARTTAAELVEFAAADPVVGPILSEFDPLGGEGHAWDEVLEIDVEHPAWTPRTWVPLVTAFLEQGRTRCVVGTRALLGEGWDCRSLNVLIDLGSATTRVSVQQVRGRSLRLDPADPAKVADNWDVVCVAPGYVRGTADYERFVRRHGDYYALNHEGEIESGVSHVDPALTPFGSQRTDDLAALGDRMLARVAERARTRAAWRVGEPYRDVPVQTVRIRMGRSPGIPSRDLWRGDPLDRRGPRLRPVVALGLAATMLLLVIGLTRDRTPFSVVAALVILLATLGWALMTTRAAIAQLGPADTLGDMGRAVAEALLVTGLIDSALGPASVRVSPQPDGYYRCSIEGASDADSGRFAQAMDDLVEPIWDPRWIIPRRVVVAAPTLRGAVSVATDRVIGRVRPILVVHHAVPDLLAIRQERVAVFGESWRRWVSPGAQPLRATDPAALRILELHRGDDPFQVETQLRTLWT